MLFAAPVSRSVVQVVRAAGEDDKKKVQTRTDPAVKRAKLGEERRMYNKARKSACATRIKKVGFVVMKQIMLFNAYCTMQFNLVKGRDGRYPCVVNALMPLRLQVIKAAEKVMTEAPQSETDIAPIEKLVAEAYQEIDKAVSKGVLHLNNAARKKARVAKYKRHVLIKAGLFTPSPEHPDYKFAQRLQQQKASAGGMMMWAAGCIMVAACWPGCMHMPCMMTHRASC